MVMKKLTILFLFICSLTYGQRQHTTYGPIWMYYQTSVGNVDSVKITFNGDVVRFTTTKDAFEFKKKVRTGYVETDTIASLFGEVNLSGDVRLNTGGSLFLDPTRVSGFAYDAGKIYIIDPSINEGVPFPLNSFILESDSGVLYSTPHSVSLKQNKLDGGIGFVKSEGLGVISYDPLNYLQTSDTSALARKTVVNDSLARIREDMNNSVSPSDSSFVTLDVGVDTDKTIITKDSIIKRQGGVKVFEVGPDGTIISEKFLADSTSARVALLGSTTNYFIAGSSLMPGYIKGDKDTLFKAEGTFGNYVAILKNGDILTTGLHRTLTDTSATKKALRDSIAALNNRTLLAQSISAEDTTRWGAGIPFTLKSGLLENKGDSTLGLYTTQQSFPSFDNSNSVPTLTATINANGYLKATRLYANGVQPATSFVNLLFNASTFSSGTYTMTPGASANGLNFYIGTGFPTNSANNYLKLNGDFWVRYMNSRTINLWGATSGYATIIPQSVAATDTFRLPSGSGTLARLSDISGTGQWIANGSGITYVNGSDSSVFRKDGTFHVFKNGVKVLYITDKGAIGQPNLSNTAVGDSALNRISTGTHNTAVGSYSLTYNRTGGYNTALGKFSLYNNNGNQNTSVGSFSLNTNTTGNYNTALGYNSLYTNNGTGNLAIGPNSLYDNTTGNYNTALGYNAIQNITSGSNNIAIGYYAGNYLLSSLNGLLIINSLDRTNGLGDTTKSIVYGYQDSDTLKQRLHFAANVKIGGSLTTYGNIKTSGKIDYTAGTSSTFVRVPGILKVFNTQVNTSTTVETDLYTYTIPANVLSTDGDKLVFTTYFDFTNTGASAGQIKSYFGSTGINSTSSISFSGYGLMETTYKRLSSTTVGVFTTPKGTITNASNYLLVTSVDFTTTNVIKMTGRQETSGYFNTLFGDIKYEPNPGN